MLCLYAVSITGRLFVCLFVFNGVSAVAAKSAVFVTWCILRAIYFYRYSVNMEEINIRHSVT